MKPVMIGTLFVAVRVDVHAQVLSWSEQPVNTVSSADDVETRVEVVVAGMPETLLGAPSLGSVVGLPLVESASVSLLVSIAVPEL